MQAVENGAVGHKVWSLDIGGHHAAAQRVAPDQVGGRRVRGERRRIDIGVVIRVVGEQIAAGERDQQARQQQPRLRSLSPAQQQGRPRPGQ